MAITINTQARNAILDSGLNTAFNAGKFRIYSGSKPATANLAPTGTLLFEKTVADFFAAASAGAIALNAAITDVGQSGASTGTNMGYFRFSAVSDDDSLNGAFARCDGTVTVTGGGGDLIVINISISSGQACSITAFTFTMPAS